MNNFLDQRFEGITVGIMARAQRAFVICCIIIAAISFMLFFNSLHIVEFNARLSNTLMRIQIIVFLSAFGILMYYIVGLSYLPIKYKNGKIEADIIATGSASLLFLCWMGISYPDNPEAKIIERNMDCAVCLMALAYVGLSRWLGSQRSNMGIRQNDVKMGVRE